VPSLSLSHDLLDRVAFCDPHGGRSTTRSGSARAAIVVVLFDAMDRIFVPYAWAKRCSGDEITDEIFRVQAEWKPPQFGIEDAGQQLLFIQSVRRIARMKSFWVPIIEWPQAPDKEKKYRIKTAIQLPLAQKRLFIKRGLHELLAEMAAFPQPNATCDILDALASAIVMHPARTTWKERRAEVDEFKQYLLDQGFPEDYIGKRVQEEFGESIEE
jgi:hypothetical protein